MVSAAVIARDLGGWRQGENWRCPCPLECGYELSLRDAADGKLLAYCFGGCGFDEVVTALVGHGLLDDDNVGVATAESIHAPNAASEEVQYRIDAACWIYRRAVRDRRIGIYLRSRSITLDPPILRFSEHAPHRRGSRHPAMIAPITDITGEQIGTHLTYLRADGGGKADLPKQYQRETRGLARGGAIRLAAYDPNRELIIAEGIESALSAMLIFKRPAWSAIYAGNLQTIELPPAIRRIVIAMDHDANGAGVGNVLTARDRWSGEGREVRLVRPPVVGDDFNNVLIKRSK